MINLKSLIQNPKVQQYALLAATYAAGAYGGPQGAALVTKYGPIVGPYLLKGLVLLFGG